MRLVLVVDIYPPSNNAAGLLMRDLAHALADEGHEVLLVTPDSSLSEYKLLEEERSNVTILRVKAGPLKGQSRVRRARGELLLSGVLWRGYETSAVSTLSVDAIIWYSPSIFLARFVQRLKKRESCPAYLILRDIFPDWAVHIGVLRKGLIYWLFKCFEHFQYSVADVIAVQSPANRAYFSKSKFSSRLDVLYNWINLDKKLPLSNNIFDSLGLDGKKVFVFGGNLGVAPDMGNLIRLAKRLAVRPDVRFLFIGAGTEVPYIKKQMASGQLPNVVLAPAIDPGEFRLLLRRCRAGLISLDRRLGTHNIPGKLLSYLEAGLPVLASLNPGNDLRELLQESGAGFAFWNGEDSSFEAAALRLADDDALCLECSTSAKILATRVFSANSAARQIIASVKRLSRIDKADSVNVTV
jgi:glycosyltransferase involved in cell wall biosynthesis